MRKSWIALAALAASIGSANAAQSLTENFDNGAFNVIGGSWSTAGSTLIATPDSSPDDVLLLVNSGGSATLSFSSAAKTPFFLLTFFFSKANTGDATGVVNFKTSGGLDISQNFIVPGSGSSNPGPGTGSFKYYFGTPIQAGETVDVTWKTASGSLGYRIDDVVVTAVPEPGTYALMLAGLGVVGFMAKRRSQRQGGGRLQAA